MKHDTSPSAPRHPFPRRFTPRRLLIAAAVLLLPVAALSIPGTAQASIPETPPGWTQVFGDDFDGAAGSPPSADNWRFDIGHGYPGGPDNWGTGEIAYHTDDPENISVDGDGNLTITPRRDANGDWTSARIETNKADFRPPPGGIVRIESRLKLPDVTGEAAKGYWPAFWALGSPYRGDYNNWPGIGEFDILENVNGHNRTWAALHCGVAPGGPCNEGMGLAENVPCPGNPCQTDFHTLTFEWDTSITPNQLRWYIDGQQYHSVSQDQLPADTWSQLADHAGYFIILNVAIGGNFPNDNAGHDTPTAATEPGHPMVVDYVAAWTNP